jgi:NADH-quinone oxidoreductase subunit C
MMAPSPLTAAIVQRFPRAVLASHEYRGDTTVIVRRESLQEIARTLKDDPAFQMNFLMDVTAVDFSAFGAEPPRAFFASSGVAARSSPQIPDAEQWPGPPAGGRFVVVYHFFSLALKHRLRVEVPIEETDAEVDSLAVLWPAADWLEREVWDMFGIRFRGHANLKRILMYDEFEGHPLRKDYPVNRRQPLIGPVN